jgi:hypothetical protein
MMNEKTWVDHYYDALAFFYWEPQHLSCSRREGVRLSEASVLTHLRSMEATLNQIMNQLFSLAPASLRNIVFEQALGHSVPGDFILTGRDFLAKRPAWDTCQPDFYFQTTDMTVCIEMKVKAHSDLNQVLKYAARALSTEQAHGRTMHHSLIFLGSGSFASMWKRNTGIHTVDELKSALTQVQNRFSERRLKGDRDLSERFAQIVSSMSITYLSYVDFGSVLQEEHRSANAPSASTHRCLIDGILKELEGRMLIPRRKEYSQQCARHENRET